MLKAEFIFISLDDKRKHNTMTQEQKNEILGKNKKTEKQVKELQLLHQQLNTVRS